MNVGQIKAFLGEQKPSVHPETAMKKQLQEDGLRQAAAFQQKHSAMVSVSSTQTTIGMRIFSSSLSQAVVVDGKQAPDKVQKEDDETASAFDFEKVAKNVLRFVTNVIQSAADSGADKSKLSDLIGQARDGVAKGIAMAEKDIGGLMNDEIASGIDSSRALINDKISDLEKRLLNPEAPQSSGVNQVAMGSIASSEGSLLIRTKDGDELRLSFESLQQFQYHQQTLVGNQTKAVADEQSSTPNSVEAYSFYERSGISFSLNGELDEAELESIAELVGEANDLADTFFGGDMDKAFAQALTLGFDDQELTGYALQLNRTQQAEVVHAYESIKHYNDSTADANSHGNVVSPIAQYLDKMMDVLNMSEERLESGKDYNTLLNGLISEMGEVHVPDFISAINRFHTFNQRLLAAMPNSQSVDGGE